MKRTLTMIIALLGITLLTSCFTDNDGAKKTLERSGYKVIKVGGYDYFSEGEDAYKTRFKAVAVNGDTVKGTVTRGFIGKGNTIRLDN